MDATIKSQNGELVIRLANGCTVHKPQMGSPTTWAPGGACVHTSNSVAKALEEGIKWRNDK